MRFGIILGMDWRIGTRVDPQQWSYFNIDIIDIHCSYIIVYPHISIYYSILKCSDQIIGVLRVVDDLVDDLSHTQYANSRTPTKSHKHDAMMPCRSCSLSSYPHMISRYLKTFAAGSESRGWFLGGLPFSAQDHDSWHRLFMFFFWHLRV